MKFMWSTVFIPKTQRWNWKPRVLFWNIRTKEDAQEIAYLEMCDDPAPDKRDYYAIEVLQNLGCP